MTCEKYQELSATEKTVMVGRIVHAMQSDNELFDYAVDLIKIAEMRGLFDNVKILPETDTDLQV